MTGRCELRGRVLTGKETAPQTTWVTPDVRNLGNRPARIVSFLCMQGESPCLKTGKCECWCAFGRAYREGRRFLGQASGGDSGRMDGARKKARA